tara:strand:- start:350 stop:967 length:618 start_codon:yes stop_codon:yes gene_type:complete
VHLGEPQRNLLLRNDSGTFVDVIAEAGLLDEPRVSMSVIWLDYDRDGFIDLYVGNFTFLPGFAGHQNILYRNQGDGTFVDATAAAGLDVQWYDANSPHTGGTFGGFFAADLNDDGWTDLYVVVDSSPNRPFYKGGGRFRESASRELRVAAQSFGATVGDIDNDADVDLFFGSGRLTFFENRDGRFIERFAHANWRPPSVTWTVTD